MRINIDTRVSNYKFLTMREFYIMLLDNFALLLFTSYIQLVKDRNETD